MRRVCGEESTRARAQERGHVGVRVYPQKNDDGLGVRCEGRGLDVIEKDSIIRATI